MRSVASLQAGVVAACKPKLVFGPLSRWQELVGKKVTTMGAAGDSILLGHYGTSTANEAKAAAKSQALQVKVAQGRRGSKAVRLHTIGTANTHPHPLRACACVAAGEPRGIPIAARSPGAPHVLEPGRPSWL